MNPEYLSDPAYVRAWTIEQMLPFWKQMEAPLLDNVDSVVQYVLTGTKPDGAAQ